MIFLQVDDSVLDPSGQPPVDMGLGERAALETLRHSGPSPDCDLTLVLTNDEQLHSLNQRFLGIDAPTDVLSFPAGGEVDPDSEQDYAGDVVISYPRVAAQAAAAGHTLENEFQLLVVHGVLHLVGYDHGEPDEKARMWEAQAQVLQKLGVPIGRLPD